MTATPAVAVPLTLTGFRAGEVKKLQIWLEPVVTLANCASTAAQSLRWVLPAGVEILYAGLKYSTYLNGSSAIWNLIDGTSPAAVDQSLLTTSSTAWASSSSLSQYVELPFAQPTGADYEAEVLVHGKEITNGIVNLNLYMPDTNTYNVHIVYVMNATVGFSKGSAELIF